MECVERWISCGLPLKNVHYRFKAPSRRDVSGNQKEGFIATTCPVLIGDIVRLSLSKPARRDPQRRFQQAQGDNLPAYIYRVVAPSPEF